MTTPDETRPEGPITDLVATPSFTPSQYRTGPLVGAGRWCPIYAPVDDPPVGLLYTDDDQVLGFIPSRAMDSPNAPQVAHVIQDALLAGAALGTPASEVFDAWASRQGRGLAAGPTSTGDLRLIG